MHRLGSFCARHRFLVLVVWLVVAVGIIAIVSQVGAKTNNNLSLPGTDSQRATDLLAGKFPPRQNGSSPIVFHVQSGSVTDPKPKAAIEATYHEVKGLPHVYSAVNPFSQQGQAQISKDKRTAFISVLLDVAGSSLTEPLAKRFEAATSNVEKTTGMEVAIGGPIGGALSPPKTESSELVGLAAAMVILSLVFGSLVAMGIPIVTAVIGLSIGLGLVGLLGHVTNVPTVAPTLATMIGLGVGIDYALFIVSRHQQQLKAGVDVRESIARSDATSGTAVVFAGGTVVIALVSLAVAGIPFIATMGAASSLAVLTAILAAITLLPALLSIAGRHIGSLRIPAFLRVKERPVERRRWTKWARLVTRHPFIATAAALALLIPLSIPLFSLQLGQQDNASDPTSTTQRQAYDLMTAGFGPGYNGPLLVATTVRPPAEPSAEYTKKYDEATSLKRHLEKQQKKLQKEAAALKRQEAALKSEQAALQRKAATLRRQEAALRKQQALLEQEKATLVAERNRLIAEARPLLIRLGAVLIHEARLERAIARTTDPVRKQLLEERLQRVRAREANIRSKLRPLRAQARSLARQAATLQAQAATLQAQAAILQAQGAGLQVQANQLKKQAGELQIQADRLQRQKKELLKQKKHAEALQQQLTDMLTKAGGDSRGTDPRLVRLQDALDGAQGVQLTSPPQINKQGGATIFTVISSYDPAASQTTDLVLLLRSVVIPHATKGTGLDASVGGQTASYIDLASAISKKLPIVILTIIGLSSLVLLAAFRSVMIPLQAAITNLLCAAAAFGVLTATFQWGWGVSLVGIDSPTGTVPIASYVPLMMFAVLFGLSMDYEVFLMSHVREEHDRDRPPREAIAAGLASSAPPIASAALIMIAVFGSFVLNGDPVVKQFGVGLSVAVALAGTMMLLLAPSILVLFGRTTWWLPRWLGFLPQIDVEGGAKPATIAGGSGFPVDGSSD